MFCKFLVSFSVNEYNLTPTKDILIEKIYDPEQVVGILELFFSDEETQEKLKIVFEKDIEKYKKNGFTALPVIEEEGEGTTLYTIEALTENALINYILVISFEARMRISNLPDYTCDDYDYVASYLSVIKQVCLLAGRKGDWDELVEHIEVVNPGFFEEYLKQ